MLFILIVIFQRFIALCVAILCWGVVTAAPVSQVTTTPMSHITTTPMLQDQRTPVSQVTTTPEPHDQITTMLQDQTTLVSRVTRFREIYHISISSEMIPEQPQSPIAQIQKEKLKREQLVLLGLRLCTGNATELRSIPGRIPQNLTHADCGASCGECEKKWRPVLYPVPVMVPTESGTQKYIQDTELVATACVCF